MARKNQIIVDDFTPILDPEIRGYDITDRLGMLEIQRVDGLNAFRNDADAVDHAIADGVPIIPVDELPDGFNYKWLGWLDTPKNRLAIAEFAKGN